jgi:phosphate:Na+ symporter
VVTKELIFSLLGGLGFFFFGMQIMSEGLKNIAGDRLKSILHMATRIPVIGILVGAAVTTLVQSSSATTVMVVGFVNAGLLQLKQAICVVMGANIGTTFTAWLVSSMGVFKVTNYALPAVGVGFAFMKLGKTRKMRYFGQTLMGFGLLFIGLSFMKDGFAPLKESAYVKDVFISLSDNPLLGVLIGVIFTVLLQSSSATIAIVQVLAFNGLISFPAAVPIILGDNIGTTITAQMAAIGTNLTARRAAMSHTLFNVIGTLYMLFFIYTGWYVRAIEYVIPGAVTPANIMFYIAIAHSAFNVVNTLLFLPFVGYLERISIFLVPRKEGVIEPAPKFLEKHLLDTPTIAIEQAKKETLRMLEMACSSVYVAIQGLISKEPKSRKKVKSLEQAVDNLQSEITQYLVDLSQRTMNQEESEELPVLIHSVNDIERISDHAMNISELVTQKQEDKLEFTEEANQDLVKMIDEVEKMMSQTKAALERMDINLAEKVIIHEANLNRFQEELNKGHVKRLNAGRCEIRPGIVYINLVDNIEKIGDHLTNIAQGVIRGMKWQDILEPVRDEG